MDGIDTNTHDLAEMVRSRARAGARTSIKYSSRKATASDHAGLARTVMLKVDRTDGAGKTR